jgi:cell fate regulator YaaT (PSP1 superfamily)
MEDKKEKTGDAAAAALPVAVDDKGGREVEVSLCAVRLRPGQTPVHCDAGDIAVEDGEWLVVRLEHGLEVGVAMGGARKVMLKEGCPPVAVERLASTREIELYYQNLDHERHARAVCLELIDELGLEMKLIRVERQYEGGKIIFYYSAEGRVDFRELVKRLVSSLQTRVEMRQIGIRHEARMIGGVGNCGRELCCSLFLENFAPVSIKMAKTQNLPLNPNKISGFCGRLLCCLTFEYDTYREIASELPSPGKKCDTPYGEGRVTRVDILQQKVNVALAHGEFAEFTRAELSGEVPVGGKKPAGKKVVNPSEWQPAWPGDEPEAEKGREKGRNGRTGGREKRARGGSGSSKGKKKNSVKKGRRKKRKKRPDRKKAGSGQPGKKKGKG